MALGETVDLFNATINISEALTALDEMQVAVDGLIQKFVALGGSTSDFTALDVAFGTLQEQIDVLSPSADVAAQSINAFGQAAQQVGAYLAEDGTYMDAFAQQFDVLDQAIASSVQGLDAQTLALQAAGQAAMEEVLAMDELSGAMEAGVSGIEAFNNGMAEMSVGLDEETIAIQGAAEKTTFLQEVFDALVGTLDAVGAAVGRVSEEFGLMGAAEGEAATEEAAVSEGAQGSAMNLLMLVAVVGMAAKSFIDMGMQAQTQLAIVAGLTGSSQAQMASYTTTLEGMAVQFGVSLDQMAQGLYYVVSAGFSGAGAIQVLTAATEAAVASGTAEKAVSDLLTSALNAYGASASQATQYMDYLLTAVTYGKQTFSELATSFGIASATGAGFGVSLKEMAAAEATLTDMGIPAHRAVMDLDFAVRQVMGSTEREAKLAQGMGLSFDTVAYSSMSFFQRLQYLHEIAGTNVTDFAKLVGGASGFLAAQDLLTNKGELYNTILGKMGSSAGATASAFQVAEQTMKAAIDHLIAALSVLGYQFVVLATPILAPVFEKLTQAIQFLTQHAEIARPIFLALAVIVGGILLVAVTAILGPMLAGAAASMGLVVAFGFLAGVIAALIGPIQSFFAQFAKSVDLTQTWNLLQYIGSYLGGVFHSAVQTAGQLLQQLGAWVNANVVPALDQLGMHLKDDANYILQNIVPALQSFGTQMQPVGNFIMTTVVPALGQFLLGAIKVADFLAANFVPAMQMIGTVIQTISPWIGMIVQMFGQMVAFLISTFTPVWQSLVASFQSLQPILSQIAPYVLQMAEALGVALVVAIGLVIGILGGLIAMFAKMLQGAIMIVTGIIQIFVGLVQFFSGLFQLIADVITGKWGKIGADLHTMMQGIVNIVTGLLNIIFGLFTATFGAIIGFVSGFVSGVIGFFTNLWHMLVGGSIIPDMMNGIVNAFTGMISTVIGAITGFVTNIITFFTNLWNTAKTLWATGVAYVETLVASWITNIENAIKSWIANIITFLTNLWNTIKTLWNTGVTNIEVLVAGWVLNMQNTITGWISNVQTAIGNVWNWIKTAFSNGITNAQNVITGWGTWLANFFGNLATSALQWGKNLIQGLINGISSMLSSLESTLGNVAGDVAKFLGFGSPTKEGPGRYADTWMPNLVDMLAAGLTSNTGKLREAAASMASAISGGITVPQQTLFASQAPGVGGGGGTTAQHLAILTQIRDELRKGQGGSTVPVTSNTTSVTNAFNAPLFGSAQNASALYSLLNVLSGTALEGGARGALAGLA